MRASKYSTDNRSDCAIHLSSVGDNARDARRFWTSFFFFFFCKHNFQESFQDWTAKMKEPKSYLLFPWLLSDFSSSLLYLTNSVGDGEWDDPLWVKSNFKMHFSTWLNEPWSLFRILCYSSMNAPTYKHHDVLKSTSFFLDQCFDEESPLFLSTFFFICQ